MEGVWKYTLLFYLHYPFSSMKNLKEILLGVALVTTLLPGCSSSSSKETFTLSGLDPARFETMIDGTKATRLYTLTNENGMEVCITNFGARIVSIMVPDKNGTLQDVVLGFDNIDDYQNIPTDFGATIGRYANRINQGKIVIDNQEYQLP